MPPPRRRSSSRPRSWRRWSGWRRSARWRAPTRPEAARRPRPPGSAVGRPSRRRRRAPAGRSRAAAHRHRSEPAGAQALHDRRDRRDRLTARPTAVVQQDDRPGVHLGEHPAADLPRAGSRSSRRRRRPTAPAPCGRARSRSDHPVVDRPVGRPVQARVDAGRLADGVPGVAQLPADTGRWSGSSGRGGPRCGRRPRCRGPRSPAARARCRAPGGRSRRTSRGRPAGSAAAEDPHRRGRRAVVEATAPPAASAGAPR